MPPKGGIFLGDEMKKVFILILIFVNFFSIAVSASERETNENIDNYLSNFSFDEIFELQKKAGNNFDDWFLFSILRSEKELDINLYKGLLRHYISDNYEKYGYLNKNLMTEWHRLIMLSVSVGLNPSEITLNNFSYDLLFDGIYNTKQSESLEKQGINSFVFALMALDSFAFEEINGDLFHSRKSLIENILSYEIPGGGFAFSKDEPDIDMSALVVQALSEYYNSLIVYNVYNKLQDRNIETTVKDVIDRVLLLFSSLQKPDGDFESYGIGNAESTAQVLISLTSLGIDIDTDERFIKNDKTVLDGIIKYQNKDGTFRRNDKTNKISGYQAFMGLVAYDRFVNKKRSIYDLKSEIDSKLKEEINSLIFAIKDADNLSISGLEQLLLRYKLIPGSERNYVYNFSHLYNNLTMNNIEVVIEETYNDNLVIVNEEISVTKEDINNIAKLVKNPKIENFYEMVYYQEKIRFSNIDGNTKIRLDEKINIIKEEKNKVLVLNELIEDYLREEDEIQKEAIIDLYKDLLKDSKKHIILYEEVNPSNFFNERNLIIGFLLIALISVFSIFTLRIIKRKRNK